MCRWQECDHINSCERFSFISHMEIVRKIFENELLEYYLLTVFVIIG